MLKRILSFSFIAVVIFLTACDNELITKKAEQRRLDEQKRKQEQARLAGQKI